MAQATNSLDLGGPPRLTGDPNSDLPALIEWVWQFYNATVVSSGFLQPDQLPDQLQESFPILYSLGTLELTAADKISYFSAENTLSLTDYTPFARQWDALPDDIAARALLSITSYTDEQVRDVVGVLVQNGTGITWTYDDGADSLIGNVTITQYTDELAQDAVGTILVDSSTIDFTYNDGVPSITAIVIDSSITTTKLGGDITAAGKALLDDANAAAQRTTLMLGTIATENAGISATIVTAKLTGLGSDGSMTFVNGLLTAQVAAT